MNLQNMSEILHNMKQCNAKSKLNLKHFTWKVHS